jgi:hypothetical protein
MQGAKGIWNSKRGVFCTLLVVCAMILVITGSITGQSWLDFAKWIAVTLVFSHTTTTAIDQVLTRNATTPPATPTP